ncbi:MAG: TonB-dependent receptor [Longimicrobiales bacterium]|nr:TonB-dependent receptor [Longimicrobiales bacterium]
MNKKVREDTGRIAVMLFTAALASLVGASGSSAQQGEGSVSTGAPGRIVGDVIDASDGSAIRGVQVYIEGADVGSLTNLDGRYFLQRVPAGTHQVTAEMIGYGTKTVTGVQVQPGGTTRLDITLESSAVEIEELVVSATRERGSSAFLMDQRRTAASMVDAVGNVEISRRPNSDAADVAKRMTGVTVSDGKYVYIRGLGERYSQTSLNGSSLPSPEPEKEVVPLDLFPSGFLESLQTQKSYTPDKPGDFSGGSVEITTKDFPEQFTVKLGLGTSFNSESQFESGYLNYGGGDLDFLGFDDGSRDLPVEVRSLIGGLEGPPLPADAQAIVTAGQAFAQNLGTFTPSLGDTPLNRSFDATVGGTTEVADRQLGFVVAGTYSDSYTIRARENEKKYRVSAFDPSVVGEDGSAAVGNVDYDFERGTRGVSWGTLGNVTYMLSPEHKLSFRTTVNVNTEDESRRFEGWNREDIGAYIQADRLRYVSRKLYWGQLSGEHALLGDHRLEWRSTLARAQRDEPGLREAIYATNDPSDPDFTLANDGESGRYFFSELFDDEASGQVDYTLPFDLGRDGSSLKFGTAARIRDRDFAARRFSWQFLGGVIPNIDRAIEESAIVPVVRAPGEMSIREVVEPGDLYNAGDDRVGGYAMVEIPLLDDLEAVGGVRAERYNLSLTSRGSELAAVDRVDWMPSVNLIWSLNPDMKLRGAFSRTLDRPEFRELAPFQFTEATSLRQIFGNPDLEAASIQNFDLRWDWFLSPGQMLSVGAFHKRIDDPIEQVFFATAGTAYSFQNGGEAEVTGIELDARLGLNVVADALENFSADLNYSWIDSEVEVRETGAFVPTNERRPLEGQASYVLNAGLNWILPGTGLEAGVYLNRLGERLTAAGGSGIPDIIERPRNQLDASLRFDLPVGGSLTAKATNLLDEPFVFQQSANGITHTQRKYWVGRTFSLGLSWELY